MALWRTACLLNDGQLGTLSDRALGESLSRGANAGAPGSSHDRRFPRTIDEAVRGPRQLPRSSGVAPAAPDDRGVRSMPIYKRCAMFDGRRSK